MAVALYLGFSRYKMESNTLVNQAPIVNSGENPEGGIHNLPVEPAAAVARKDLAVKLGGN